MPIRQTVNDEQPKVNYDDRMCCENFRKVTGECLRIMIKMLAKASVDLLSPGKKKSELLIRNNVTWASIAYAVCVVVMWQCVWITWEHTNLWCMCVTDTGLLSIIFCCYYITTSKLRNYTHFILTSVCVRALPVRHDWSQTNRRVWPQSCMALLLSTVTYRKYMF